ncbi:MAG: TatD family hydrolase [candidate division WOR-3 bacterium]
MIDTHCHLVDPQFSHDLEEAIERARAAGLKYIINIGYDLNTSISALQMNEIYDFLLPAVGIHPNESVEESLNQMESIETLLSNKQVVAIGETGLDYHRNYSPPEVQESLFRYHINLARRYNLPLIIHTRNSITDVLRILEEENYHRGVFHCYSGTYEQAKKIMDLGFYLGFGGVLTFSKNMREVFLRLPLDFILLETDAPFLAPASKRGRRNEPAFIREILNFASGLKGLSPERLEEITDQNAGNLFSLKSIA